MAPLRTPSPGQGLPHPKLSPHPRSLVHIPTHHDVLPAWTAWGSTEHGTPPGHPYSPALVPTCATHLPPPRSQTQPGAADCPHWATQLQFSSLSFFPQRKAPCPSVPMALVQVPVKRPVPQLQLHPPQQVRPASPPASWPSKKGSASPTQTRASYLVACTPAQISAPGPPKA